MGDQGEINMFPQNGVPQTGINPATGEAIVLKNFNGSAYKTMENEIVDWIDTGGEVRFNVKLEKFDDLRPGQISVAYDIVDPKTGDVIFSNTETFLNQAGETFERVSKSDMSAYFDN